MSLKLEEVVGKSLTEEQFDEAAGKKDACYHKVKARYDVWPSAYASGALVKCRKVGAKNWGNKSKKEGVNENQCLCEACWKGYEKKGMKKMFGKMYPNCVKKKRKSEAKLNEEKPYETILRQLGGNRFIAMTGAKNLGTSTKKDLSFSIGRNAKKVTHVHIKLTSMDLYDVEFINMRGAKRKVIKKVKGVYGDMLPKIFKKYTGMNVRL